MIPPSPYPALTGAGARRLANSNDRVVVVGAGGWLGLATLEALHRTLGDDFHERVACFGSNARVLRLRGGVEIAQAPLGELSQLPSAPSLVLHLAFLTQEKAKTMSEADYVAANRAISRQVLDALDIIGATGVFVASSGAAYMAQDPAAEASKRLYGQLKLEDETAFTEWAEGRGARAAIARVFNVSGPYINKLSSYALAAFIADALAGRPIAIKARRPVIRSYVAISELMSVVFGLLTDGESGASRFDTAGERALEMSEIARAVRAVVRPSAEISAPDDRRGTPDRYVGDRRRYRTLLERHGVAGLDFEAQVGDTAGFMAGALGLESTPAARTGTEGTTY